MSTKDLRPGIIFGGLVVGFSGLGISFALTLSGHYDLAAVALSIGSVGAISVLVVSA